MGRRKVRQGLAYLGVVAASLASIATTEPECPRVTTHPDEVELPAASVTAKQYRVSASWGVELRVVLDLAAEAPTQIRVSLAPDDPQPFRFLDGGTAVMRELAVQPGGESVVELVLPACRATGCDDFGVTLKFENVAGAQAQAHWEVIVATIACGDDHTLIEEL